MDDGKIVGVGYQPRHFDGVDMLFDEAHALLFGAGEIFIAKFGGQGCAGGIQEKIHARPERRIAEYFRQVRRPFAAHKFAHMFDKDSIYAGINVVSGSHRYAMSQLTRLR